jgi:hypothetical protein
VDRKAVRLVREKQYQEAISLWENLAGAGGPDAWAAKKNLAVLSCLLLFTGDNPAYMREALRVWKEILGSDAFWVDFAARFAKDDDLGTTREVVDQIRKDAVLPYLSDFFAEMRDVYGNNQYVTEFQAAFAAKGEKAEQILDPIYAAINEIISDLNTIIREVKTFEEPTLQRIDRNVAGIRRELKKLLDLGFYNDSNSRIMRDRAADILRRLADRLAAFSEFTGKSLALSKIAREISGTESIKYDIQDLIKYLETMVSVSPVFSKIIELINKDEIVEAYGMILQVEKESAGKPDVIADVRKAKRRCIYILAWKKYESAMECWDRGDYTHAKPLFVDASNLVYNNLDIFDFDKAAVNSLINKVKDDVHVAIFQAGDLSLLDTILDDLRNAAQKQFGESYERDLLVLLARTNIYAELVQLKRTRLGGAGGGIGQNCGDGCGKNCGCFVITAAMGDRGHPHVLYLQNFRDGWLVERWWGRLFTAAYEIAGPYPAAIIRRSPALRAWSIRCIVKPGIRVASWLQGRETEGSCRR